MTLRALHVQRGGGDRADRSDRVDPAFGQCELAFRAGASSRRSGAKPSWIEREFAPAECTVDANSRSVSSVGTVGSVGASLRAHLIGAN